MDSAALHQLPVRLVQDSQTPFVGRDAELELVETAWKEAVEGQRRLVLIAGEPGIGKTALARALAEKIVQQGTDVLYGRCHEDLSVAYQPWREALAQLLENAPPQLQDVFIERSAVLGTIGLRQDNPADQWGGSDQDIYVLFGAILDVLAAAAAPHGLALILDDMHWADVQSLQLLHRLAIGTHTMPVLICVTFRDSEVVSGSAFARLLADLRREPNVTRITLKGLGDLELLSLMEIEAGHEMDEDGLTLRDALMRETDGNPFFVGELLHHLKETGALTEGAAGHWISDPDVVSRALPAGLSEVIGERVARLGGTVPQDLSVASVIGREFDLSILAAATELSSGVLLDELDASISASLVADLGDGRFSFTHALIERALYNQLSPTRRAFIHLQVATAIEEEFGNDPERAAEIARHWMNATIPQDTEKALAYSKRAADHALAGLAPDEARRWYTEALGLLEQQPVPNEHLHCELLVGLGDAQRQCGDASHRATLLRAANLAKSLDNPSLLVRAALANTRGFFAEAGQVDMERVEVLEEADRVTRSNRDESRARVLALLAAELAFGVGHESRRRVADQALTIARELGESITLLGVLNNRIAAVQAPDTLTEVLSNTEEALNLAEQVKNPVLKGFAAGWRYFVAWQACDRTEADRMWRIMEESATRLGQPTLRWLVGFLSAHRAAIGGSFEEADRLAEEAMQLGMEIGQPDAFSIYGSQILRLGRERDHAADFIPLVEQVLEGNPKDVPARTMLARLYCDTKSPEKAQACISAFVEQRLSNIPFDVFWLTCAELIADTVADLKWRAGAELLVTRLRPYANQWDWIAPTSNGPVARPLGRLFAVLDDGQAAEQYFQGSIAICQHVATPLHLAHAYLDHGRALTSGKDPDIVKRSIDSLKEAQHLAQEYAFPLVKRLASEELECIG